VKHDSPDSRPSELQEDRSRGGYEIGVNQKRERGKQEANALDAVSSGLATEERIDDSHLYRLGPDGIYRLRPAGPRNPLIAVRIEHAESQKSFGGNCGE
jgi:hypothetical protein